MLSPMVGKEVFGPEVKKILLLHLFDQVSFTARVFVSRFRTDVGMKHRILILECRGLPPNLSGRTC